MAACGGEADRQRAVAVPARMDGDAAPARAVGVDHLADGTVDSGACQCVDHQLPLPGMVIVRPPVLDRAAAAAAEIGAERIDPVGTPGQDGNKAHPSGLAGRRLGFDGFARQRAGNIAGAAAGDRNAVAALADMIDQKRFSHDARR